MGGLTISAGSQEGGEAGLTLEDLKTIRKTASVEEAAPVIMQNTKIGYRNEQMDALVWGIDTKASQVISLQVYMADQLATETSTLAQTYVW